MRKGMFIAGVAVGFIAGARAGRDTYDKMVAYARQVAEHPKVQQATSTVQAKTADLTKQAAAKAPDYAKGAMSSVQSTVSTQVPKFVQNVRQTANDKMPARFRSATATATATADPATDGTPGGPGTPGGQPDDVGPDGNLIYPADDAATTAGRGRPATPDTP
jgi:gas vesicle protein